MAFVTIWANKLFVYDLSFTVAIYGFPSAVGLSICPFACPSSFHRSSTVPPPFVRQFAVHPSVSQSVFSPVCPFIRLSVHQPIGLPSLTIPTSTYRSSVHPSVTPFIHLSVWPSPVRLLCPFLVTYLILTCLICVSEHSLSVIAAIIHQLLHMSALFLSPCIFVALLFFMALSKLLRDVWMDKWNNLGEKK